jgi:hypothetical protein
MVRRIGRPHARFGVVLLLQFGLLFWLVAFDRGAGVRRALDLTSVIIPLFAIGVATSRKRERRIAVGLAVAAIALSGGALSGLRPGNVDAGPLFAAVFSAYATWVLLAGIVRSERVTGDVLAGALAAYVMAGLAFAATFPDLVYFSFVTLLTIGFGDVTPAAPLARAVVLFEGLFGVIFTTVVMASLVAAYLRHREGVTPR